MTLHPFGDNFTEQREKYTLSGGNLLCKEGKQGGEKRNNWGRLPNFVERLPNFVGRLPNFVGRSPQ